VLFFSCCGSVAALPAVSPRKMVHMQAGQCDSQMGTNFGRWCATSTASAAAASTAATTMDAQLDRIYVFCHEASGGKYVPHAVLMDL